jgi:hypothetical protein
MAWESGPQVKLPGLTAAGDLSTKQYYFVKLASAKTVTVCTAVTDKPIGVLQNKPSAAGQAAEIVAIGVTKLSGDANLNFGDSIGTSVDGQAAAYTASDTTKYIVGQVIVDNSAAGGLVTALINCANARTLA